MTNSTSVFISYANEDASAALELADSLRAHGFEPWIDKVNLVGGEDWNFAIGRAIREADVVVVLLSSHSVRKRGYVQREIKIALDLWKEKLEDDIYLIPVRVAPCEVPAALRIFQRVDLFESRGRECLIRSIRVAVQRRRRMNQKALPFYLQGIAIKDSWTEAIACTAEVSFPRIIPRDDDNGDVERANALLCRTATQPFEQFLARECRRRGELPNDEFPTESSIYIGWTCTLLSEELMSVQFVENVYSAGAAHPSHCFMHCNASLNPFRELRLSDLINEDGLAYLQEFARSDLCRRLHAEDDSSFLSWIHEGTANPGDYGFNIYPDELVLLWEQYEVASYIDGPQLVEVPLTQLESFLHRDSLLRQSSSVSP